MLTLSAREQHIRREKAVSNSCSNQGLALTGNQGLKTIGGLCWHKSHYAASQIAALKGFQVAAGTFFIDGQCCPLGSCTMKYNPKVHEEAARLRGFTRAHPLLPLSQAQGALKLMYRLQEALKAACAGKNAETLAGLMITNPGTLGLGLWRRGPGSRPPPGGLPAGSHEHLAG